MQPVLPILENQICPEFEFVTKAYTKLILAQKQFCSN